MKPITVLFLSLLLTLSVAGENPPAWTEPVEPFTIIGNVHYVGTADLTSFLITSPQGHILLDAPMEENVPHLIRSIEALGFDPADIEILINSHAHFDHAGGFAKMKEISGARLIVSAPDAELMARGGLDDFAFGDAGAFTPVEADAILEDGDWVELGGSRLQAIATPGHTMGGTSWVMDVEHAGRSYRVLFANSMSAPGYDLVANDRYPRIMSDYHQSFERLEKIDAEVFLSTHGSFFDLSRKAQAIRSGSDPKAFINPDESQRFIERWRGIVEGQHARQQAEIDVAARLDQFHDAASRADGETYFSLFAPNAIFIGTDASERWTVEEFRAFADPYFSRGQGWTYEPIERHVYLDTGGDTAWFDEILDNASYGTTRGTGVLVRQRDGWKIAQYHLTIPIPNEIANDVVKMIRE